MQVNNLQEDGYWEDLRGEELILAVCCLLLRNSINRHAIETSKQRWLKTQAVRKELTLCERNPRCVKATG